MPDPAHIVAVETLANPHAYTPDQIRDAFDVAYAIGRGKLIYVLPPRGPDAAR